MVCECVALGCAEKLFWTMRLMLWAEKSRELFLVKMLQDSEILEMLKGFREIVLTALKAINVKIDR